MNTVGEEACSSDNAGSQDDDSSDLGLLLSLDHSNSCPERVPMIIQGKTILFEIDCGACRSVIHVDDFDKYLSNLNMYKVKYDLRVLTGQNVSVVGETKVEIKLGSQVFTLPLVVLFSEHKFVPLLGRNWLNVLSPGWREKIKFSLSSASLGVMSEGKNGGNQVTGLDINVVSTSNTSKVESEEILKLTSKLSTDLKDVFDEKVGSCIKGFQVELKLKDGAKPTFHRAYDMPFALKERVEHELLKMVQSGILRKF